MNKILADKLIILDRDGVINLNDSYYVTSADDFQFQPMCLRAIAQLYQAGFKITIATNQAGIDRGVLTHADLASIHAKMLRDIRLAGGDIERILYADKYDDNHPWRKPNAGMLLEIMAEYGVSNKGKVLFIGDSMGDLQAAVKAGCKPILVRTGKGAETEAQLSTELRDKTQIFDNLYDCSQWLIGALK